MLVLTRSSPQEIRIGDDVVLRVVAIESNRVRLAIQAPRSVRVRRSEQCAAPLATGEPSDLPTRHAIAVRDS